MDRILLCGLLKIELPAHTIRLCDGGFLTFGGEDYASSDQYFGTIGGLEALSEGVGDEVPGSRLTFLPDSNAAAATLSAPGMQGSRIRFWIAEVDPDTGLVIGTPDQQADMQVDRTVLKIGRGTRSLEMDMVSRAERLFVQNEGNSLSPEFHKSVWPGETGEDNATGLGTTVAWGVEGPPRGSSYGVFGGSPRGAFDNRYINYV
jgi:hypothetical protein